MSGPRRKIDELDRRVIERLRANGREGNRSLAASLGVNEATIAARLRRLEAEDVVHVVALTDMEGFGYEYLAFALVRTGDGHATVDVAAELALVPEVVFVNVVTGRFDIICGVLVRDRAELGAMIGEVLAAVDGVASVRCELAVDVLRFDSQWAALQAGGPSPDAPRPDLSGGAVDALDLGIIEILQRDARTSNRSIATALEVSEGTVRVRLRRMEDEQLIRIRAVSDVQAFDLGASATVGVHAARGATGRLGAALAALDGVAAVIRSVGEFDFLLIVAAADRPALLDVVLNQLQRLEGVASTETFETAATLKHVYTWVRLLPD